MRVFQTLIQTVFLYACQSCVLGDKERATLQGSYTRMLRFAQNIPFTDHPSLERIYGATPSVLATIARYRLHMLGSTFRYERECPQPLIRVVRWLLTQHIPVTSTLPPRAREQRFSYADQLLRDVRCLTRRPGLRPDQVLSILSSPTDWRTKVIDQVAIHPFYRTVPALHLPSVLDPITLQSPPRPPRRRRQATSTADPPSTSPAREGERLGTRVQRPRRRTPLMLSPLGAQYRLRTRTPNSPTT